MKNQKVFLLSVARPSMARAIRQHCLQCSGDQTAEVRDCVVTRCPLYPYRFGCKPKAAFNRLSRRYDPVFIDERKIDHD